MSGFPAGGIIWNYLGFVKDTTFLHAGCLTCDTTPKCFICGVKDGNRNKTALQVILTLRKKGFSTFCYPLQNIAVFMRIHKQMHSYHNGRYASAKIHSNIGKHTLNNMSQALKQSGVAGGASGLYLLHEFRRHSRENKERVF